MQRTPDAAQMLKQHGISATYQRLAVLKDLIARRDHPRAEDIWFSLRQAEPPISKATVYNVLKLLVDKGVLKPVFIDTESVRYDIEMDSHGHFHCDSCGHIYNFEAEQLTASTPSLKGFEVTQRDLYYRGICPNCRESAANQERGGLA